MALAAERGLAPLQQEGAAFLAERDYAILTDEMGCISGAAMVSVRLAGRRGFEEMPLRELFRWCWTEQKQPEGWIIAATDSAFVGHPITSILSRGQKPVWRVSTERRSICVTDDHEFQIFSGAWVPCSRLDVGQRVRTIAGVETIVHMCEAGTTDVYDVVCADPHRNFVANGFVVHNCGKTVQALVAAEARLSLAVIPEPNHPVVLIVCPALAKWHWQREIAQWTGHESTVLEGMRPGALPETRYVIANYDILYGQQKKDKSGKLLDIQHLQGWGQTLTGKSLITIFDEAHKLRTRSSKQTLAAKAMCQPTPVVWALTGTPVPNYVRDLYSVVDLITMGLFGMSYWNWAKTYCGAVEGAYGMDDTGSSNLEWLSRRLGFFCLGRSAATMGLQLPEKRREVVKIDVEVSAPTVHEGHQATMVSKMGFVGRALRTTATAKRSAVVAHAVEALQSRQKVVVFVYMREQADLVAKGIRAKIDCTLMAVSGDMSPEGRDAQAKTFRECSAPACFVATIDSVAVAISLVGADLVIYGDLVPEPWKLLQSEKRCHRLGSTKRVLVRYLIGAGTLDEAVAETVIKKLATIEQALSGDQAQENELSTLLGAGQATEGEIIDGLFARLAQLKGAEEDVSE